MIPVGSPNQFRETAWSSGNIAVEPHIAKTRLEEILREWESHFSENEKRTDTAQKILTFYNIESDVHSFTGAGTLDLEAYRLQSLPDIFSYLPFRRLTEINLSGNELAELPESICQLQNLIRLDLSYNNFTELPENLTHLGKLAVLDLENNNFAVLPRGVISLPNLTTLYLGGNQLTNLQNDVGRLKQLEILDLSENQFIEFPESIAQLRNLEDLNISENSLLALPEDIDWPNNLKCLDLSRNILSSLPEKLCKLTKLESLYLFDNEFTQFASWINRFPEGMKIDLGGNQFSVDEVERILDIANSIHYMGPDIEGLDICDTDSSSESIEEEIETIYDKLYSLVNIPIQSLINLPKSSNLQSWLNRLFRTSDFRSEENKKSLAQKVLRLLIEANNNDEYRQIFLEVIKDASSTCGDRVALSILHLDINYQIRKADLTDIKSLASLLARGVWVLSLLEKCAREKIATLKAVDPIEVYLAYPIKLKEKLQIPIALETMRYFNCSSVNDSDLEQANHQVLEQLTNGEAYLTFLSAQEEWKKAISINYPEEWKLIEHQKKLESEQAKFLEDYTKIQKEFTKKIKGLSDEILKGLTAKLAENPLEILDNLLEKARFNPKAAAVELSNQRERLLQCIFKCGDLVPDPMRSIAILLASLKFLYLKGYIEEKKVLDFLLPSLNPTQKKVSLACYIKSLLPGVLGTIYIELLSNLCNRENLQQEIIHRIRTPEKGLIPSKKSISFLMHVQTIIESTTTFAKIGKEIDIQFVHNLTSLETVLEKCRSKSSTRDWINRLRLRTASSATISLKDIIKKLNLLQKYLKYTQDYREEKINTSPSLDEIVNLCKTYQKLELTSKGIDVISKQAEPPNTPNKEELDLDIRYQRLEEQIKELNIGEKTTFLDSFMTVSSAIATDAGISSSSSLQKESKRSLDEIEAKYLEIIKSSKRICEFPTISSKLPISLPSLVEGLEGTSSQYRRHDQASLDDSTKRTLEEISLESPKVSKKVRIAEK